MSRYVTLLFLVFLSSCLDPVSFDNEVSTNSLVVDATLNLTESIQIVKLSRSLLFGQKVDNPELNAEVYLVTEDGELPYQESEEGVYLLSSPTGLIESGQSYALRIITADGEEYLSQPEEMPILYPALSAESIFERDLITLSNGLEVSDDVLNTYISTDLPEGPEPIFLRWLYDELYIIQEIQCGPLHNPVACYVSLDGNNQNFNLLNSSNIDGLRAEGIRVASKSDFPLREFSNRHYFLIYQMSITAEAYNYWLRVKEITSQQGTVFDKPPAPIVGNIFNINDQSKPALGYFELAAVDTIRPFIFPSQFADAITRDVLCRPSQIFDRPRECCNCLSLENSTLDRPPWIN